jgi:hypothetical protein
VPDGATADRPGYDHGGEAKVASTRTARLLAFAGNALAVVIILDTLARLSRGELVPAHSAETAADRLRADPALGRRPHGPPPLPTSSHVTRSPPAGSRP